MKLYSKLHSKLHSKLLTTGLAIALVSGCAVFQSSQTSFEVKKADMSNKELKKSGEGLAKPIPNQPILVNNQLIFAAMGDAVLGISMAVGAINNYVKQLSDLQAINVTQHVQNKLASQRNLTINACDNTSINKTPLTPYLVLEGHPNPKLVARFKELNTKDDKPYQVTSESQKLDYWKENKGKNIQSESERLFNQLIDGIDKEKPCY